MTISTHEKIHPLPGGIYDDGTAASRNNNDAGMLPDFSLLGVSVGKLPTAGSWIGLCFVPSIAKNMPGYAALRIKGTTTGAGKVRVPLFDHPDGG